MTITGNAWCSDYLRFPLNLSDRIDWIIQIGFYFPTIRFVAGKSWVQASLCWTIGGKKFCCQQKKFNIWECVSHLNFGSSITCTVLKILSKLSSSSNQINCCSVESPCRAPKNDLAFNWTFTLPLSSGTHTKPLKNTNEKKTKLKYKENTKL